MAKMEFGELDQYLFGQATHYDIYKKLGAHPVTQNGKSGTYGHRTQRMFLLSVSLMTGIQSAIR